MLALPTSISYDSLGFELERLLPGGVSQSFAYDNIGRLVDSKTRRSVEQRCSRYYNWGSADRLLSIEDDRYGLTQYSYSPSGELTMATYADGTKEYRLSDKVGNLYNDPDKKLRNYLEGGSIEKSGEWTFKYDKDGQLIEKFRGNAGFFSTKKDCWEYHWTQNGMLEGVRSPHRYGQWTRFTYDALGRRLTKLGDVTFHDLWNGNVPLHEWRTGNRYVGSVLTPYSEDLKTWLFEEESFVPLALIQDGKAYSIVCDQLGTPTEAYDEEGKEVWYPRLDMNGKILEETQPGLNPEGYVSIPFLFQGQYYDHETGLAYNRFRYYDPELGRYISQDPIGLVGGLAMHAYVQSTHSWVDILGLAGITLAKLFADSPDFVQNLRQLHKTEPQWQGIDPDKDLVFYRTQTEVNAIRRKPGEQGGHHPWGLALGGPEGQTLTKTNETRKNKNPKHSAATALQRKIIKRLKTYQKQ